MSFKIPFNIPSETIPNKPIVYTYHPGEILSSLHSTYDNNDFVLQEDIYQFLDQYPHVKHQICRYLDCHGPDGPRGIGFKNWLPHLNVIINRFNHPKTSAIDPEAEKVIFLPTYCIRY